MTEPKTDYRDTVFLPKTDFPMRGNLPHKEPELLARWKALDLYGKLRMQGKGREKFILHDGPPYANGNIHLGTALTKILKDTINRAWQMLGYDAPYVPGWDCHGLPIEWKIEEQYREKGKDKDQVPVLQFRAECRAFAEHWMNVQSEEFQRLGVVGNWAHPYTTMTHKAEAQILREIYKFLQNGLLYRGVKSVMWSVVEKTALAEAEVEYEDHVSTAVWVKFPVIKSSNKVLEGANIVIWTTTPWTIPANRAIAYGDFKYCIIETGEHGKLVVASDLAVDLMHKVKGLKPGEILPESFEKIEITTGNDLAGTICAHPFRGNPAYEGYFDYDVPLYPGDFVTTDAGTGFVHIAPGHGEDDFNLGQKYKIKFDETVGDDGRYLPNVKGFSGLYVYKPDGKEGEANVAVIKALAAAGALLAKGKVKHSYPHSWRSKAPLIFRTTPQWFIAMDQPAEGQKQTLRELAMKAIGETKWYPAVGENRIRGMIENRPDWCISRQRAWGVPIALFIDKKTGQPLNDKTVLDIIAAAFEKDGADAWYSRKPQEFLGAKYKTEDFMQVFDIVDVWFESGSTHVFVLGGTTDPRAHNSVSSLPAKGKEPVEWPELHWPADLYCEGSDQHRGWFQSSLLESCGTLGRAPYKNVVTNGFTLDEKGRKMSKSLGNVVAPQEVIEKMGAEVLRLWVMSTDYMQDMRAGPEILKQTGDLYRRLRNTFRYLLGALDGMSEAERLPFNQMPELERWVLHRLSELDHDVRKSIATFDFNRMLVELHKFCNGDLSGFYFDVRKDSLYCDRPDSPRRRAARTVMEHLFNYLVVWLAPILSFTAEEAWLMRHPGADGSVHMQVFPEVPKEWRDEELGKKWATIREIRSSVTMEMEVARNKKEIGSSLQAHPIVSLHEENAVLLEGLDFSEICISSGITLKTYTGSPPEGTFNTNVPDVRVKIDLAQGKKCERCWQVLPEVGSHADHPDLCNRCYDAVTHIRKAAA